MRKILVVLLISSALMSGWAYDMQGIKKGLKPWQPIKTVVNNKTLKIVLNERRVTNQIYQAVIGAGCFTSHYHNKKSFEGINEIEVLNKFSHQGFVFRGGKKEIQGLWDLKNKESEIYIASKTHTY